MLDCHKQGILPKWVFGRVKQLLNCADEELCKTILLHKGVKNTRQRVAVMQVLGCSSSPMTAEEIYQQVVGGNESLSLSTVYRILDALEKKDIITKTGLMESSKALYEMNTDVHRHNLICLCCHKITPVEGCPLSDYENALAQKTGYEVRSHKLEVYGICPDCKKGGAPGGH